MVKSSKKQIKQDEERILQELQVNAKDNIDNIAKRCGFSRQKVWRIMKRLEQNKIIWGYTAITDDEKRKINTYVVLIKRAHVPVTEKFADKIIVRKIQELVPSSRVTILDSMYMHGVYDWLITFTAPDIREAKKFSETLIKFYQGFINDLELLETMYPIQKQGVLNPNPDKLREFM